MKKFTQSLNVAKQTTLEKLGKAEKKADTEEALKTKEDLSALRHNYTEMGAALKKYADIEQQAYAQGGVLAEALATFGASQEGSVLASILAETSRAQRGINEGFLTWLNLTREKWSGPVQTLIDTDLKRAKDLKDRQESARMKLDIAMSELESQQKKAGPKLAQVESEHASAKERYDTSTRELTSFMEGLKEKIHQELAHQLRDYAEAQLQFFTQGVEVWKATLDALSNASSSSSSTYSSI